MKKLISVAMMATVLSGCVIHVGHAKEAKIQMSESLSIDQSNITTLIIDNGAGEINVLGSETTSNISVDADIRTDNEDNVIFTLKQNGTTAYLTGTFESTMGNWSGSSPSMDLDISLPEHIALVIDDGSGNTYVKNMKSNVSIDDGSGSIEVTNIKGNVEIDDGSGSIAIDNVIGSVAIDDGSGNINVDQITGIVNVEDGSGNISVTNTDDTVIVDDGSGNIHIRNTKGLNVLNSGSGNLEINEIKGTVSID